MRSTMAIVIRRVRFHAPGMIQVWCLSLAVFLVAAPLFSQGNQGRITGTITDQSGGVIAGATVTVKDVQRGVSRTLTTGDSGEYNAPNLLPGTYAVRAEAKGFKVVERQNILLEVGKDVRIDLSLQPGEQSQTIMVTGEPPMVETTSATLGGTLSNETINDLPLNGRNYITLLTLRPGMTVYAGGGNETRSANGTRAEDIGYLLDGLRNDDSYTGSSVLNAPIPAGDSSTSLPIDAIQEFNTEENPKAEFGWKPGAIVNAGVKSGANALHGTAFAFGRDTALDARNFFDPAPLPKAVIGLEQFAASLGGAIKKDKLFYFVNYEGQRYSVGGTILQPTPFTVAQPGASGGSANGCKPTFAAGDCAHSLVDACNDVGFGNLSPLSAQIAGLNPDCSVKPTNYTPVTGESLFAANDGSNPAGLVLSLVSVDTQDNGVAKIDYHISDRHSLSGMYFRGVGGGTWVDQPWEDGVAGGAQQPFMSNLWGYIQARAGSWTWTPNSTIANELRGGYDYFRQDYDSLDASVNPLKYGINTGVTDSKLFGFPLITMKPYSPGSFRLGGNWPKHIGPDGSLQILDHVSLLRGKHTFKFGGEIIHNTADPYITQNGKGHIRVGSIDSFLTGQVYTDSKLGSFGPYSPTGLVQVGMGGLNGPFHGDHNNLSPRVGFAWDVHGNGKT